MEAMNGMTPERMGLAEAIGILAGMATRRGVSLEEVRALQVANRTLAKRLFDRARYYARKRAEKGGTATALPNDDGGEAQGNLLPPRRLDEIPPPPPLDEIADAIRRAEAERVEDPLAGVEFA